MRESLQKLGAAIQSGFAANKRVMAFADYLELAAGHPTVQLRSAPQVAVDCFEYFGSREIERPWGRVRRFDLFDCPWAEGRDRLIGQEEIQNRVYRALRNFVQEGAANKLILLHGPNGSAKSTFIRCVGRALQEYSNLPEGALYRINWIFPGSKTSKSGIGFSGKSIESLGAGESYAFLPDELIDAKVVDELRDHPMFLIPPDRRRELMREWLGAEGADDFILSDYLLHGRLSHKNRAIYEALLTRYQGDYLSVLRHVQVERFYIRHRYREGYVTVEPQLSVDAGERQITADRSITALPAALQSVTLFEYGGELVHGNRGLIEYSDLLKRPLEAYKYLLTTVEHASVSLPNATLFLDLVFIGSSNEIHLSAFKEIAEFQSFRGRLELVRAPYLLDYTQEQGIYQAKLREAAAHRHIAPHSAYVVALWSVLTRMRKPMADKYPKAMAELIGALTPLEKAELYALGKVPAGVSSGQAKDVAAVLGELWTESESYPNYEGRTGVSPREIQTVIFNAATSTTYPYVSPLALLDELEELCKHSSVYDFLRQEAQPGGYHQPKAFIGQVRDRLVDRIDDDVRTAMGMVEDVEYQRLFDRYVHHVLHWTKKEKVRNPTTGKSVDPDEKMMEEVEATLGVETGPFRGELISRIGAWSLDHAGQKPVYADIFSEEFEKLRESYFREQRQSVSVALEDLYKLLTGNVGALGVEALRRATLTRDRLLSDGGYIEESARDAIALLVRERYRG